MLDEVRAGGTCADCRMGAGTDAWGNADKWRKTFGIGQQISHHFIVSAWAATAHYELICVDSLGVCYDDLCRLEMKSVRWRILSSAAQQKYV